MTRAVCSRGYGIACREPLPLGCLPHGCVNPGRKPGRTGSNCEIEIQQVRQRSVGITRSNLRNLHLPLVEAQMTTVGRMIDTNASRNGYGPISGAGTAAQGTLPTKSKHTLSSPVTTTTTTGIAGSKETASGPEMLLPRRHPRFSLLLASLIVTALLLLLPRSPLAAFQSSAGSGSPSRPLKSPVVYQGVAARVRRAERAYQKMLRGRDALIAKVGPTPRDVALSVWFSLES